MPDPVASFLSATEAAQLRAALAAEKARNRRLIDALCLAVGHLVGHPGTDRLLADLHTPDSEKPPAAIAEGCTSPATHPATHPAKDKV